MKQYILDHPERSAEDIAEDLATSPSAIRKTQSFYRKQGIDLPYGKRGRPDKARQAVEPLLEEGLTTAQITKRTGLSASHVYKLRSLWKAKKGDSNA